ncbi:MAG: response regulator [Bacteroidetes bacterium]|jgi:CheY-like chemotaxis protein|nr:response regulator [Bacteroidota bacterium]
MKTVHILLVEDNDGDIYLTREALEDSRIINEISVARDGVEALDFMFKTGNHTQATTPDLVLLDINLPLKSGHEVLETLKSDPRTKQIPVIMLTTSSSESDIVKSYAHHANCYITKPVEIAPFLEAIGSIENFWFSIVTLPNQSPA